MQLVQSGLFAFIEETLATARERLAQIAGYSEALEEGLRRCSASTWRGEKEESARLLAGLSVSARQIGVAVSSLTRLEDEMALFCLAFDLLDGESAGACAEAQEEVQQAVALGRVAMKRGTAIVAAAELVRNRFISLMPS